MKTIYLDKAKMKGKRSSFGQLYIKNKNVRICYYLVKIKVDNFEYNLIFINSCPLPHFDFIYNIMKKIPIQTWTKVNKDEQSDEYIFLTIPLYYQSMFNTVDTQNDYYT